MLTEPPIDPSAFIASVQPLLEGQDLQGLLALLQTNWTEEQITALFKSDDPDARKVAALAFALVGKKCCLPKLAPLLKDSDPMVHQMAEHAMWSVWFRCGSAAANQELAQGAEAVNQRKFSEAVEHFTKAIEIDPAFAEAYNQRAIVHYLQENYEESIEDCMRTVERMPLHFGAWAGMGHCHAHEGRLREAIESYQRALAINPALEGIRQVICELRAKTNEN